MFPFEFPILQTTRRLKRPQTPQHEQRQVGPARKRVSTVTAGATLDVVTIADVVVAAETRKTDVRIARRARARPRYGR